MNDQPKVFVSHSSEDKPFVRRLVEALVSCNISIWYDEQSLCVGDSILDGISRGLSADYLLVVLSVHSVQSHWVKKELHAKLIQETSRGAIAVLPVLIDDCEIPPLLCDRKYADFRRDFNAGLQSLLHVLLAVSPLLRDLERAGELKDSELRPIVLKALREETELELVEPYDRRWVITGIRAADYWFRLIRSSAGQHDWQQDFGKTAMPILVGVARSLRRSADAQAVVVRLCEAVAKRLRVMLVWPEDPDELNDLRNALYRECLGAKEVDTSEEVLLALKRLTVVGPA